jgi:hypothetical protein
VILQAGKVKASGPVDRVIADWVAHSTGARRLGVTELEDSVLGYLGDGAPTQ